MTDTVEITTEAELVDVLGVASGRAVTKERSALLPIDREWLAQSTFVLLGTSDAEGNCDVSPKGDPAGFALPLDDRTLAIPDRAGNRRADSFRNVLVNPHVGLLFLVPGRSETLRINGRARLVREAPWFDQMVVKGHRPVLALVVDIDTIFLHCPKAFIRSALWKPETWQPEALPSLATIVKTTQAEIPETVEDLERHYGPQYLNGLYASSGNPLAK